MAAATSPLSALTSWLSGSVSSSAASKDSSSLSDTGSPLGSNSPNSSTQSLPLERSLSSQSSEESDLTIMDKDYYRKMKMFRELGIEPDTKEKIAKREKERSEKGRKIKDVLQDQDNEFEKIITNQLHIYVPLYEHGFFG